MNANCIAYVTTFSPFKLLALIIQSREVLSEHRFRYGLRSFQFYRIQNSEDTHPYLSLQVYTLNLFTELQENWTNSFSLLTLRRQHHNGQQTSGGLKLVQSLAITFFFHLFCLILNADHRFAFKQFISFYTDFPMDFLLCELMVKIIDE